MITRAELEKAVGFLGGMFKTHLDRTGALTRSELTDLMAPSSAPILRTTLNATPVPVVIIPSAAGFVYSVGWRVKGYDRDNARCYMQEGTGLYSNVAGTLTELATSVVGEGQHAGGAMAAPVTVVGTTVSMALTGEAAGTLGVDWDVRAWVTDLAHLNASG